MVEFQRKDFYSYEDFLEIMRLLRAPGGCPWDREQTHSSIRRNFLEETYEVLDAIDHDDASGMCEELGDTLIMAAKIAQMSGVDPEDALHRACDKFDRRFRAVEEAADKPLPECGEAELLALWNDAKSHDPS